MSSHVAGSNSALYFIAILLIFILIRMRRIIYGTKVSVSRTIGYSAYYVVFGGLVLSGSFSLPIPNEFLIAYPILFIVSFFLAFEIARRRVVFWKGSDGSVISKGGMPIYVIYVVGLIARIAIGYFYVGPDFLFPLQTMGSLSPQAITATIATDLLLIVGVGLLFGRNMRILKKYLAVRSGKETLEFREDEESSTSVPT